MEYGASKSRLECSIPGCKSGSFASAQNLARHTTARHGELATMLCGKKRQDVRFNYHRHLFESCVICKNILRKLGGQDLRADFKDTSLDTLHRMHREMVQQSSPPAAQGSSATSAGSELEGAHDECKTPSSLTTWSTQTSEGRRYASPVLGLGFNPSPKSASFVEPNQHILADPNHPTHYCGTGLNMEMYFQQGFPTSTHFEDAIESIQQYQINFDRMQLGWVLYEIDEE
ncbi:hypothetical protein ColLi_09566 [Colletotrichum liriopes]|uniref:Uncharacterized protein n=1 Tax=Colletotrichum liriopes TaxID=708192 RepID=A0AA37LWN0_9PEZI|nr:hypothetical protein ColLi_09566 [Colletotrichum liriopes]